MVITLTDLYHIISYFQNIENLQLRYFADVDSSKLVQLILEQIKSWFYYVQTVRKTYNFDFFSLFVLSVTHEIVICILQQQT